MQSRVSAVDEYFINDLEYVMDNLDVSTLCRVDRFIFLMKQDSHGLFQLDGRIPFPLSHWENTLYRRVFIPIAVPVSVSRSLHV